MQSTHIIYILAAAVGVVAFALVLMLKEVPLRTMSALQEMQQEDAAAKAAAATGLNDPEGAELERELDDVTTEQLVPAAGGRHAASTAGSDEATAASAQHHRGKHEA